MALQDVYESENLVELFEKFDSEKYDYYNGLGQNILFADTSGNIGYRMLMTIPERKDKTPFIGSRVLDGTTTNFDWVIHCDEKGERLCNPWNGERGRQMVIP